LETCSGAIFPLQIGNAANAKMARSSWSWTVTDVYPGSLFALPGRVWIVEAQSGRLHFFYSDALGFAFKIVEVTTNRIFDEYIEPACDPAVQARLAMLPQEPDYKAATAQMRAQSAGLPVAERTRANDKFKLAFSLFQQGEFLAATNLFRDGLGIFPADGSAHYYYAETLARMKRPGVAREHYHYCLELAPDTKESALAVARLSEPLALPVFDGGG
jgi:TolA-binding protein